MAYNVERLRNSVVEEFSTPQEEPRELAPMEWVPTMPEFPGLAPGDGQAPFIQQNNVHNTVNVQGDYAAHQLNQVNPTGGR